MKWIKRMVAFTIIAVLLFLAYVGVTSKITGKPPTIIGHQLMTVLSGSMEPSIKTGSVILVKQAEKVDVFKVGDVITFYSPDKEKDIITHRIIEIKQIKNGVFYKTKGDNNDTKDLELIPKENVIAKYQNISIPYLGYIFSYVASKNGLTLIIFIPGVVLILSQIVEMWKMIIQISALEQNEETSKVIKSI